MRSTLTYSLSFLVSTVLASPLIEGRADLLITQYDHRTVNGYVVNQNAWGGT